MFDCGDKRQSDPAAGSGQAAHIEAAHIEAAHSEAVHTIADQTGQKAKSSVDQRESPKEHSKRAKFFLPEAALHVIEKGHHGESSAPLGISLVKT